MTYEKWIEAMTKEIVKEIIFPSSMAYEKASFGKNSQYLMDEEVEEEN